MQTKKSKRIFYFDALRALAIVSVILIHVFDGATINIILGDYAAIPSLNWFIADFVDNCLRIGVVLFLILSGALSLGRNWSIRSFLGKRIPRIVLPFLFWGFILSLMLIGCSYFFNYSFINSFDLGSILNFIYNAYMANMPGFWPYWFFWMIIGTYLIMPIFNKWIANSSINEVEYFLVIWLITCLFTFTLKSEFPIKLTYFTSPIGLVVLGYYLRHTERKLLNNPYFDICLIVISWILMVYLSYRFSSVDHLYRFNRYSILNAMDVIGIVLLFKNWHKLNIKINFSDNPNGIFRKFVALLAKCSYGLYLTHSAFLQIFLGILPMSLLHYRGLVIVLTLLTIFVPLIVLTVLDKVPYLNDVIGVK